jgi:hypothetical protein
MNCRDCEHILQSSLDCGGEAPTAELTAHLQECVPCRERFQLAERLCRSQSHWPGPELPSGFTDRITATLLRDRRKRLVMGWTLRIAAVLVLGTLGVYLSLSRWLHTAALTEQEPIAEGQPQGPVKPGEPTPSLVAQLGETRDATVERTKQVARDTARGARLLLPPPESVPAEPLGPWNVEAPAMSMGDVSRTVAEGFEPVTDSAKRAWGMFRRLITPGEEKKKG